MNVKKLIQQYLEEAQMLQIATSKNNQPWVATVYFATDKDMNIFWISKPTRRHSVEIEKNSKAGGVIVLPHKFGNKVHGLQFQGTAKQLKGKGAVIGVEAWAKRYKMSKERIRNILNGTDGHLIYRIKPSLFVLFDEINFPNNPRQEIKI